MAKVAKRQEFGDLAMVVGPEHSNAAYEHHEEVWL